MIDSCYLDITDYLPDSIVEALEEYVEVPSAINYTSMVESFEERVRKVLNI